jgi:hypothetical protein
MIAAMLRASYPVFLLLVAGCHQIEPPPPPLRPHSSDASANAAPTASPSTKAHDHDHGPPAGAIVPRVVVEQVEPGQEALAQAIVAAAKPSLDDCRANAGGGLLKLTIVSSKSREQITIDPSSTVSESMRECVLEALSALDVPDTLSQSSPSSRPSSGFSSIFTVAW